MSICGKTKRAELRKGDDISDEKIPELYETENIPLEKKTIYRRYQIKEIGFYWLIAELDKGKNLAFGYANLNDDELAEWGYIDINELLESGAEIDKEWRPCSYKDAMNRITKERNERRFETRKKGKRGVLDSLCDHLSA